MVENVLGVSCLLFRVGSRDNSPPAAERKAEALPLLWHSRFMCIADFGLPISDCGDSGSADRSAQQAGSARIVLVITGGRAIYCRVS